MTPHSRTILVVDDDAMIGELIATILDAEEFQTAVALNGAEGVRLARTIAPAAIFCDLSMPGMSGEDVIRALRADPCTNQIPFVLMTGHVSSEAKPLGADAFLQKPFRLDEIMPLLNSVLRSNEERSAKASRLHMAAKEGEVATLTGFEPVLPP